MEIMTLLYAELWPGNTPSGEVEAREVIDDRLSSAAKKAVK